MSSFLLGCAFLLGIGGTYCILSQMTPSTTDLNVIYGQPWRQGAIKNLGINRLINTQRNFINTSIASNIKVFTKREEEVALHHKVYGQAYTRKVYFSPRIHFTYGNQNAGPQQKMRLEPTDMGPTEITNYTNPWLHQPGKFTLENWKDFIVNNKLFS